MFGLHFIKEGIFDKKFARYLKDLKEDRENGYYGILSVIEEDDTNEAISEAEESIQETNKYLNIK